jgi:hypothetical protein
LKIDSLQSNFLWTKSDEWSNEQEARMFDKPSGYHVFPKGSLKNIFVGEFCKFENIQTIKNWVSECQANVVIKKAKFISVKQKLEFHTV